MDLVEKESAAAMDEMFHRMVWKGCDKRAKVSELDSDGGSPIPIKNASK
jgi:hypothetical protein